MPEVATLSLDPAAKHLLSSLTVEDCAEGATAAVACTEKSGAAAQVIHQRPHMECNPRHGHAATAHRPALTSHARGSHLVPPGWMPLMLAMSAYLHLPSLAAGTSPAHHRSSQDLRLTPCPPQNQILVSVATLPVLRAAFSTCRASSAAARLGSFLHTHGSSPALCQRCRLGMHHAHQHIERQLDASAADAPTGPRYRRQGCVEAYAACCCLL